LRFSLIDGLFQRNFLDLQSISNEKILPTFYPWNSIIRSSSPRRLDGIFLSPNVFLDFLYCGVFKPLLYKSDHRLVTAFFADFRPTQEALSRRNNTKRKKFNFSAMDHHK